jgi:hypothetical protein
VIDLARRKDIHIRVAKDFQEIRDDFYEICDEKRINASAIIRDLMTEWVAEWKKNGWQSKREIEE